MKHAAIAVAVILLAPGAAMAEVSDKMPGIGMILLQGAGMALVIFLLTRVRWWLGLLSLPIFVLSVVGTILLWQEVPMREALLIEQGPGYFLAHVAGDLLLGIACVVGAMTSWRRQRQSRGLTGSG